MKTNLLKYGMIAFSLFAVSQVNAQSEKRTPEQVFAKMDSNSDQYIDLKEFTTAESRHKTDKPKSTEEIQKKFAKMDTNADGKVSNQEFIAMHERRKARKTEDRK